MKWIEGFLLHIHDIGFAHLFLDICGIIRMSRCPGEASISLITWQSHHNCGQKWKYSKNFRKIMRNPLWVVFVWSFLLFLLVSKHMECASISILKRIISIVGLAALKAYQQRNLYKFTSPSPFTRRLQIIYERWLLIFRCSNKWMKHWSKCNKCKRQTRIFPPMRARTLLEASLS